MDVKCDVFISVGGDSEVQGEPWTELWGLVCYSVNSTALGASGPWTVDAVQSPSSHLLYLFLFSCGIATEH